MSHILLSIEMLCLSVIVGGGIVLGGSMRHQFIKAMKHSEDVQELETLHISIWNAYNRISFIAVIGFLAAQIIFRSFQLYPLLLSIILLILFLLKLIIDTKLKKRAQQNSNVAKLVEQRNEHIIVEIISIVILLLSVVGLFFIF